MFLPHSRNGGARLSPAYSQIIVALLLVLRNAASGHTGLWVLNVPGVVVFLDHLLQTKSPTPFDVRLVE